MSWFISLLADFIQNIHIREQYEKFDMGIDVRIVLAFSLLRNGLILENAHVVVHLFSDKAP